VERVQHTEGAQVYSRKSVEIGVVAGSRCVVQSLNDGGVVGRGSRVFGAGDGISNFGEVRVSFAK
jgi:hypothetical protein